MAKKFDSDDIYGMNLWIEIVSDMPRNEKITCCQERYYAESDLIDHMRDEDGSDWNGYLWLAIQTGITTDAKLRAEC